MQLAIPLASPFMKVLKLSNNIVIYHYICRSKLPAEAQLNISAVQMLVKSAWLRQSVNLIIKCARLCRSDHQLNRPDRGADLTIHWIKLIFRG